MKRVEALACWIVRRRFLLAALCAALTLAALLGAARVGVDNSLGAWFVEEGAELAAYRRYQARFGNDEIVVIAFERGPPEPIERVASALGRIDGIAAVRRAAEDGAMSSIVLRMGRVEDVEARREAILAEVDATLAASGLVHHKAGVGVLLAALNQLTIRDGARLFALSALAMAALLRMILGSSTAAAATLGVGAICAAWSLGLIGAAGRDLNMVTAAVPTVVLVVGTAEMLHLLLRASEQGGAPGEARAVRILARMLPPCGLNIATSAAGFGALALAPLPAVRDLGIFCALGLAGTLLLTAVGGALALASPRIPFGRPRSDRLRRVAAGMAELGLRHPAIVLAASALAIATAVAGAFRIEVDTSTLEHLRPTHPVRRDAELIERRLGPSLPLEFVVVSEGRPDPALLRAIRRWQHDAGLIPGVGASASLANVLERFGGIPADAQALGDALAAYRASPLAILDPRLADDGALRVTFAIRYQGARSASLLLERIRSEARLPEGARIEASGYLPLYLRMVDLVVEAQVGGFALAFATVFGLIAAATRSWRLALLAIPSNLLPLVAVLGAMGWMGIRLDVATATIAAIVLGLVVDDTVHFAHRLREELPRAPDVRSALRATAAGTGRAVLACALVLGIGFAAFAGAEIASLASLGLLVALALGTSAVADLLVVPAVAAAAGLVRARAGVAA